MRLLTVYLVALCVGMSACAAVHGEPLALPYLQDVTPTAITVMWETDQPAVGTVVYSANPRAFDAGTASAVFDASPRSIHEVRLHGLRAGTRYCYVAKSGAWQSGVHQFSTAPAPGAHGMRLGLYGDSRSQPGIHARIASLLAGERPDIIVNSGDVVADGTKRSQWETELLDPVRAFSAEIPFYTVLGNHERNSPFYFQLLALPGVERWWSTDYASVHLIGLDTQSPGDPDSEQYRWLEKDLASPAARAAAWRVVVFHQPLFSGHPTRPVSPLRAVWHPLFMRHGVDVVVQGHDHFYVRTKRIGEIEDTGPRGIAYVTAGGGGAPLYDVVEKPFTAKTAKVYHYAVVDFTAAKAELRAIDINGNLIDSATYLRGAPASPGDFIRYEDVR